mgnify:CR=1 FL=1
MTTKEPFAAGTFETIPPEDTALGDSMQQLINDFAEGQAAIQELALLKPTLALALSKLPKQQLKLSLTDQTSLGDYELQAKREQNGSIVLRAVKSL